MVPKLIYSKTKTAFESYFTDLSVDSQVYKSIVFTEDGYFWTHGKFFRLFPDAPKSFNSFPLPFRRSFGISICN